MKTIKVLNSYEITPSPDSENPGSIRLDIYDCTDHIKATQKSFVNGIEQGHYSRYFGFRIYGVGENGARFGSYSGEAYTCESKATVLGFARAAAYGNGGFPLEQYVSQSYVGPHDSRKYGRFPVENLTG
jgi:hypothetical protein